VVNINCSYITFNGRSFSFSSCPSSSLVCLISNIIFHENLLFLFKGLNFNQSFTKVKVIHLFHFHLK
jgi:hypothetical protein